MVAPLSPPKEPPILVYTLINATPSPYGRKVAIVLHEKNIPFLVRWEKPWEPTTIVGDYSPLQQLPILLAGTTETVVAYDSTYILEYLEIMHPEKPMLPTTGSINNNNNNNDDDDDDDNDRKGLLLERKIQMLAERLMEVTQTIFFELQRAEETRSLPWLERQSKKIGTGLAELDKLLMVNNKTPPAVDDPITLGDVALGSTLTIFEFPDVGMPILPEFAFREKYPRLGEYLDALASRPSFEKTVPVMFDTDLKKTV